MITTSKVDDRPNRLAQDLRTAAPPKQIGPRTEYDVEALARRAVVTRLPERDVPEVLNMLGLAS
jgi:hypothetical protein